MHTRNNKFRHCVILPCKFYYKVVRKVRLLRVTSSKIFKATILAPFKMSEYLKYQAHMVVICTLTIELNRSTYFELPELILKALVAWKTSKIALQKSASGHVVVKRHVH